MQSEFDPNRRAADVGGARSDMTDPDREDQQWESQGAPEPGTRPDSRQCNLSNLDDLDDDEDFDEDDFDDDFDDDFEDETEDEYGLEEDFGDDEFSEDDDGDFGELELEAEDSEEILEDEE